MGSTKVHTRCPGCDQSLRVQPEMVGKSARCPTCHRAFIIASVSFNPAEPRQSTSRAIKRPAPGMESAPDALAATARGLAAATTAAVSIETTSDAVSNAEPIAALGQLGRFTLHEVLGRGGFGIVYRAHDPLLDRQVALKTPLFAATDRAKAQRFLNEAKAAAQLRHPNIVAVYEAGESVGRLYIAAELVKGETLAQRINQGRPTLETSVAWVQELAGALAYAHEQGIVHRDIKPQNIMIKANGRPQIMDFGLAKRLDQDAKLTTDGSLLGTPAYMSAEQARGDIAAVGPKSDQYSLGAVLYELITGQKPFTGAPALVIAKAATEDPPAARAINDAIPRDLEAICQKAMEKSPARRYHGAAELAEDLARWSRGESVRARPLSNLRRARRWVRRSPRLAALILAVAGLLTASAIGSGVGAVLISQSNSRLNSALAEAKQQSQAAVTLSKKAESATRETRRRTALANNEARRALAARQANQTALVDLQAEMARRSALEKELNTVSTEREIAAADATMAARGKEETESLAAGAEQAAHVERVRSYAAHLKLVQASINQNDFDTALKQLADGEGSLRGWEWRYLQALCQRRVQTLAPKINAIPTSAAREGDRSLLAVSADGALVACHYTKAHHTKRNEPLEIRIYNIAMPGSALLVSTIDVTQFRTPPIATFSRDNSVLCTFDQYKSLFLRWPLNNKRPRATNLKKWKPPLNSRPVTNGLSLKQDRAYQILSAYNADVAEEGARLSLPLWAETANPRQFVVAKDAIHVYCSELDEALLTIPIKHASGSVVELVPPAESSRLVFGIRSSDNKLFEVHTYEPE